LVDDAAWKLDDCVLVASVIGIPAMLDCTQGLELLSVFATNDSHFAAARSPAYVMSMSTTCGMTSVAVVAGVMVRTGAL
jgi:hypothetical protein